MLTASEFIFKGRGKYFFVVVNISLKYSDVRCCFEAFIATNTAVQSNFDFDTLF